jgi:hypothetical protein
MQNLTLDLSGVINSAISQKFTELNLEQKLQELLGEVAVNASKTITVVNSETTVKMGVQHKQFTKILHLVNEGENLMVKGEAGNGKSHVIAEVAKALNLDFHSMSVSNQTTKTDLLGFVDANGIYRSNGFIKAFKDGGLFNMDEIDAGNANVLVVLNSALSNGFVETPAGDMIYKHPNFRFTATANTVGTGATSKYVGRNKLDSATLDRFAVLNFELDDEIEFMLCGRNKVFHDAIKRVRLLASKNYQDFSVSQRSSTRLFKILKNPEFSVTEALEISLFKGCNEDISKTLEKEFKNTFKQVDRLSLNEMQPKQSEPEYKEVEVDEITEDDVEEFSWN